MYVGVHHTKFCYLNKQHFDRKLKKKRKKERNHLNSTCFQIEEIQRDANSMQIFIYC